MSTCAGIAQLSTRCDAAPACAALPPRARAATVTVLSAQQRLHPDDRLLCPDQPERAEDLHHARGVRASLHRALRRRLEGRPVQARISQDQSEQQDPGDRRSRRARRQALHRVRVRRDPDVSRREDRQVHAEGHGGTLRGDPVADDPAHRRRADVRAAHAFQDVRAQGRRQLRPRPLPERGEAALRRAGEAARRSRPSSAAASIRSPTSRPSRGRATTTPRACRSPTSRI